MCRYFLHINSKPNVKVRVINMDPQQHAAGYHLLLVTTKMARPGVTGFQRLLSIIMQVQILFEMYPRSTS
jgi:hypothetical protein